MRDLSAVVNLRIEEGAAGFGVYILVLQVLRDMPNYRVADNAKRLAFTFNESDVSLVDRVLHKYGLFETDADGSLFSPWLCAAMGEYDDRKKKLQEAGRRGAAHRWRGSSVEDGKAIASPSVEDGKAIAQDLTYYNVTQDNFTLPNVTNSPRVDEVYLDALMSTQKEGHAPGYVAQVCLYYGMKVATCEFICEQSENARTTNPIYLRFAAIVKRIQQEKWVPKHPDGFFLKKIFENE